MLIVNQQASLRSEGEFGKEAEPDVLLKRYAEVKIMDSINDSMAHILGTSRIPQPRAIVTAADCMRASPITFRQEQHIQEVIDVLLKEKISGGPVCDEHYKLVGIISEMDCLRAVASGDYDGEQHQDERLVKELMTKECITVTPHDDIYRMAHLFDQHNIHRLPVIEDGVVIGQVSRRDLLAKIKHLV